MPAAVPAVGLVGHWTFESVTENRVADRSPTGNALVLAQPRTQAEPGGGASLVCDGFEISGRVDERTPLLLKTGATLAVCVWPARGRGYEPLFGRPNPTPAWTTPTTGIYLADGRVSFGLFSPAKKLVLEGPALPLRAWSFVVATADGREVALWVDGRKVADAPQTLPIPPAGDQPWLLGCSTAACFRGRLGDALVWDRALSAGEIAALQATLAARFGSPRDPSARADTERENRDRFIDVASPGSRPDAGPWRVRPTRTLEGLAGFAAASPPALDRWGGRLDRPARAATGFFRTEQTEGRWWLVTPEGHLFWNVGINAVRPPRGAEQDTAAFAARTTAALRALGFNGLGNWSSPELQRQPRPLPWSVRLNFMASFAQEHRQTYPTSGHTGFTAQCFPVFHPEFPAWARRHAASLAATADDPAVLGIFTDNELECPADLLDRHLKLPETDPYLRHGRAAALAWLAAEGRPADPAQLTRKDRYRFIAYVFGTYARIVHEAIRGVDRQHLIFGSRYNVHRGQFDNPWFWTAVAPWIDVAAVNYYALWGPQPEEIQEWSAAMQRPVMLTEWYAKALDAPGLANTKGAGWLVRTQLDRARYYQHFVLAAAETPALVGVHYFKFLDDDADSVALDSAGGANKGMWRADGSPWPELQAAAREVNTQIYPLLDFFAARRSKDGAGH